MKTLLLFSCLSILLACNNGSNSRTSYNETKLSLEEQEKLNPLSFLSADGTYRKNLFGAFVMDGTIRNQASVAVYKDPVITFHFYSKTGTHLGDESRVWYEFIEPGKSFSYNVKITGYGAATTVKMDLTGAKAAE